MRFGLIFFNISCLELTGTFLFVDICCDSLLLESVLELGSVTYELFCKLPFEGILVVAGKSVDKFLSVSFAFSILASVRTELASSSLSDDSSGVMDGGLFSV